MSEAVSVGEPVSHEALWPLRSEIRRIARRALSLHGTVVGPIRYQIDPVERHGLVDSPWLDRGPDVHIVLAIAPVRSA